MQGDDVVAASGLGEVVPTDVGERLAGEMGRDADDDAKRAGAVLDTGAYGQGAAF